MSNDNLMRICFEMLGADLPVPFVFHVYQTALSDEGIEDLAHLWAAAGDDLTERAEIEADLQESLDERSSPASQDLPLTHTAEAEVLLEARRRLKDHIRALVEQHGGVSAVARQAEMPQPSLSRLLNSLSLPRAATLHRLADAMGIEVSALSPPQEDAPQSRRRQHS